MKLASLIDEFELLAPMRLAEPWDNVGLLAGDPSAEVGSCLVALDYSRAIFEEAGRVGAQLILTHHPLIFETIRSLRTDRLVEKELIELVKSGLGLVSLHTNLDKAVGGLNDILADAFEMADQEVLLPDSADSFKLVVYVPVDSLEKVQEAIFDAGGGVIGKYRACSFYSIGTGSFEPMTGARPAVRGKVVGAGSTRPEKSRRGLETESGRGGVYPPVNGRGKREEVEEARLEVQVPKEKVQLVMKVMWEAHPYEEVAYDLLEQKNISEKEGLGRIGNLRKPLKGGELLALAGEKLASLPKYSGDLSRPITRLAVCSGSGGDLVERAAAAGADAFIAGDLKYHTAFKAGDQTSPLLLIDAGHFETERYPMKIWTEQIRVMLAKRGVMVRYSKIEENPWRVEAGIHKPEKGLELKKIKILCDGGARGNPGPAGIGAVFLDDTGVEIARLSHFIGEATNNVAEYTALIRSLEKAKEMGVGAVEVVTDSELMDRQMRGEYRVKNEGLKPLHVKAQELSRTFASFSISHTPREALKFADALVNEAIDDAVPKLDTD